MAGKRSDSNEATYHNAISTLKRAAGLPSSLEFPDVFRGGQCNAFTTDQESADILANLIAQALMGLHRHTEQYWSKHGDSRGWQGSVSVNLHRQDVYRVGFCLPEVCLRDFSTLVDQKVQKLIAPDKPKASGPSR